MAGSARVVIQRDLWRVVASELPDAHGVLRTEYFVELTDPKAKDLLGVQKWTELKDASAMGDHVKCWRFFLDELLKAAGEEPNATNKRDARKQVPQAG